VLEIPLPHGAGRWNGNGKHTSIAFELGMQWRFEEEMGGIDIHRTKEREGGGRLVRQYEVGWCGIWIWKANGN